MSGKKGGLQQHRWQPQAAWDLKALAQNQVSSQCKEERCRVPTEPIGWGPYLASFQLFAPNPQGSGTIEPHLPVRGSRAGFDPWNGTGHGG